MTTEGPHPHPAPDAEIVTLVMDGGTAYVLTQILALTIDNLDNLPEAPRDVLIHAYDEIAGQLGDEPYANRDRPEPRA